jgi:hypothetical protein
MTQFKRGMEPDAVSVGVVLNAFEEVEEEGWPRFSYHFACGNGAQLKTNSSQGETAYCSCRAASTPFSAVHESAWSPYRPAENDADGTDGVSDPQFYSPPAMRHSCQIRSRCVELRGRETNSTCLESLHRRAASLAWPSVRKNLPAHRG